MNISLGLIVFQNSSCPRRECYIKFHGYSMMYSLAFNCVKRGGEVEKEIKRKRLQKGQGFKQHFKQHLKLSEHWQIWTDVLNALYTKRPNVEM